MKAYITTEATRGIGFYADVVTEQDYHDGGPHAHSFRSRVCAERSTAEDEARQWAERNGCTVTNVDEVAA